jgi:hypothetical protein
MKTNTLTRMTRETVIPAIHPSKVLTVNMCKRHMERYLRLCPGNIPKYVRVYDDGKDGDRYTVVFTGNWPGKTPGWFPYLGMSCRPFHPQGIGQHGESEGRPIDVRGNSWGGPAIGRRCHLGVRIKFEVLPPDCQALVLSDYHNYWRLT